MTQSQISYFNQKQRNRAIGNGIHLNDDIVDFKIGEENSEYDFEEHEQFI